MKLSRVSPVTVSFCVTVLITLWASANINWGKEHYKTIIKSDGRGYYAYLPAMFIYNDLHFGFFDTLDGGKYYNENLYYDYRSIRDQDTVNKYYAGTAIPMMPFFLVAHGLSRMDADTDADGYSRYYQISINVAALVFMALALWVMARILRLYAVREGMIAFLLPVMVFGTNWFYYIVAEPAMSHPYSVFFIAFLALMAIQWNRAEGNRGSLYLLLFAAALGLVTAIRPVNVISVLLLPVFAQGVKDLQSRVGAQLKKPLLLTAAILIFLVPVMFQLVIYRIQTGSFWVYSYGEEGFHFLNPQIASLLFSYQKGFFVYTPVALVALAGMYHLFKRNKWEGGGLAVFFILITYLFASWWDWKFGGSFSSRVYLDYMVIFILPLGVMLNDLRKKALRMSIMFLLVILTLFSQFQTYQYRYEVIHWEQMNKEKYWDVFLNVDFIRKKKH